MALQPLILEMGTGIDLHGQDYTLAAQRAVRDAIQRNSLLFLRALGVGDTSKMQVEVTVGIPHPQSVNQEEVLKSSLTAPALSRWCLGAWRYPPGVTPT